VAVVNAFNAVVVDDANMVQSGATNMEQQAIRHETRKINPLACMLLIVVQVQAQHVVLYFTTTIPPRPRPPPAAAKNEDERSSRAWNTKPLLFIINSY